MATTGMETEAFHAFAYWSGILVIKFLLMGPLTSIQRFKNKAFINPEDIARDKRLKIVTNDEDVERVRRAHRNDMENILPFFIVAWLYCYTHPVAATANLLFKIFTISRIAHSFVYALYPLPQPSRVLSYLVGFLVTVYLAVQVILYFA